MTRLFLLRHGETDWNRENRLQGHLDQPLNSLGMSQAHAAAKWMSRVDVDYILSSDLMRARQTAVACSEALNLPLTLDESLRERNLGRWQGMTKSEVTARWGEQNGEIVPEGEDRHVFRRRAMDACRRLVMLAPQQTILAVTHGGVIAEVVKEVLGLPAGMPRRFHVANGSFTLLEFHEDIWKLVFLNAGPELSSPSRDVDATL